MKPILLLRIKKRILASVPSASTSVVQGKLNFNMK